MDKTNSVAKAIWVCGIITMVCGVICGFLMATASSFSFFLLLVYTLSGIFLGILLFGFAEIIELLQNIRDREVKRSAAAEPSMIVPSVGTETFLSTGRYEAGKSLASGNYYLVGEGSYVATAVNGATAQQGVLSKERTALTLTPGMTLHLQGQAQIVLRKF